MTKRVDSQARAAIADVMPSVAGHRIAVFDLDGTLTRNGTWSPFLVAAARALAPWRLVLVPIVIGAMIGYKLGLVERRSLKQFMQRCLMGRCVHRQISQRLAARFADRLLSRRIRGDGLATLSAERARGRRIILASAANRFYLDAIAERLGIDEVIGTESLWAGDMLLPLIAGDNCHGVAKRDALFAYLAREDSDLSAFDIRFYSDDAADLPLLEAVGEPIAVNPSRKLRAIALRRGWQIVAWK